MGEHRTETASMLIRWYNMQAGTSFRTGNEVNQRVVLEALDRMNGDVSKVREEIRKFVIANPGADFKECFISMRSEEPKPEEPNPTEVSDKQVQYSMSVLEQAVIQLIAKTQAEKIESEIMGNVEDKVREFIKSEYGTIERKITTVVDGRKVEMQGIQHEKFEEVLKYVANNEPVFLVGPAGSGKNVLCKQVADALGLDFYFTNAVTQEYQLKGFTDAMGTYHETQFYKAFVNGGLFMLDEMDASIPEVLVILNAALANRYYDFPDPIGFVEAHPDFRVIAAGNTYGYGASIQYVGRNQLDGASLDRFGYIPIEYSEAIENAVALGDAVLADFCRDFRKAAEKSGLNIIVSYRAISRIAKMMQVLSLEEAIKTSLVKGIDKDDINMILSNMRRESKYKEALRKLV